MLPTVVRAPRTAEDIGTGIRLARMQGKELSPAAVVKVLQDAGVRYVLVGAHAANGYTGRPRATVDVDIIVQYPKKAAEVVAAAFPHLTLHDTAAVTRFMDGDVEAIELMKSASSKLWGELLKDAVEIEIDQQLVCIPKLEGVLAAKFAAMSSPGRKLADKMIDGGDFIRIVEANPKIDLDRVRELGELVFPGGGAFAIKLVEDARAGRRLEF